MADRIEIEAVVEGVNKYVSDIHKIDSETTRAGRNVKRASDSFDDAGENIEEFSDSIGKAQEAVEKVDFTDLDSGVKDLAADFEDSAPLVDEFTGSLEQVQESAGALDLSAAATEAEDTSIAIADAGAETEVFSDSLSAVQDSADALDLSTASEEAVVTAEEIGAAGVEAETYVESLDVIQESADILDLSSAVDEAVTTAEEIGTSGVEAEAYTESLDAVQESADALDLSDAVDEAEQTATLIGEAGVETEGFSASLDTVQESADSLDLSSASIEAEDTAAAIGDAGGDIDGFTSSLEDVQDSADVLDLSSAEDSVASVADMFDDGVSAAGDFGSAVLEASSDAKESAVDVDDLANSISGVGDAVDGIDLDALEGNLSGVATEAEAAAGGAASLNDAATTASGVLDIFNIKAADGTTKLTDLKTALLGIAAGAGLLALPGQINTLAQAAIAGEQAQIALTGSIENTGVGMEATLGVVDKLVERGEDLAFSSDTVKNSFVLLLDATGNEEEAARRLEAAFELARAKGLSLEAASRLLGKVTEENVNVFRRLNITLPDTATEAEAVDAVLEKFSGRAEGYAASTAGQFEKTRIEIGNLQEAVGQKLLPVINDISSAGGTAVRSFGELDGSTQVLLTSFLALVTIGPPLFNVMQKLAENVGKAEAKFLNWNKATNASKLALGGAGILGAITILDAGLSAFTGKGLIERMSDAFKGAEFSMKDADKALKDFIERLDGITDPQYRAEKAQEALTLAVDAYNKKLQDLAKEGITRVIDGNYETGTSLRKIQDDIRGTDKEFTTFQSTLSNGAPGITYRKDIFKTQEEVHALGAAMADAGVGTGQLITTMEGLPGPLQEAFKKGAQLENELYLLEKATKDAEAATENVVVAVDDAADVYGVAERELEFYNQQQKLAKDAAEKLVIALDKVRKQFLDNNITVQNAKAQIAIYRLELSDLENANRELNDTEKARVEALQSSIAVLENIIEKEEGHADAISETLKFMEKFVGPEGAAGVRDALAKNELPLTTQTQYTKELGQAFLLARTGGMDAALEGLTTLRDNLGPMSEEWQSIAKVIGPAFVDELKKGITDPAKLAEIDQLADALFGKIPAAVEETRPQVQTSVANVVSDIVTPLDGIDAHSLGVAIPEGLAAGIAFGARVAIAQAEILAGAVISEVGNVLGYGSPATAFIPLGEAIPEGLAIGMEQGSDIIENEALELLDELLAIYEELPEEFRDIAAEAIDNFADAIDKGKSREVIPAMKDLLNDMEDIIKKSRIDRIAANKIKDVTDEIKDKIKNGGTVREFQSLFRQLENVIEDADLDDEAKRVAVEMLAGFRQGIVTGRVGVFSEVEAFIDDLIDAFDIDIPGPNVGPPTGGGTGGGGTGGGDGIEGGGATGPGSGGVGTGGTGGGTGTVTAGTIQRRALPSLSAVELNKVNSFVAYRRGHLQTGYNKYGFRGQGTNSQRLAEFAYSYGFRFPTRKLLAFTGTGRARWAGGLPSVGTGDLGPWPVPPPLNVGGVTSRDMIARLHANEAVIPLDQIANVYSRLFKDIPVQANGGNITVDLRGSSFMGTPQENGKYIERAVEKGIQKHLSGSFAHGVRR